MKSLIIEIFMIVILCGVIVSCNKHKQSNTTSAPTPEYKFQIDEMVIWKLLPNNSVIIDARECWYNKITYRIRYLDRDLIVRNTSVSELELSKIKEKVK